MGKATTQKIEKFAVVDPNPNFLGLIAIEVVVWLHRLAATKVVGQISIFIYSLAIVHLYMEYLYI